MQTIVDTLINGMQFPIGYLVLESSGVDLAKIIPKNCTESSYKRTDSLVSSNYTVVCK